MSFKFNKDQTSFLAQNVHWECDCG